MLFRLLALFGVPLMMFATPAAACTVSRDVSSVIGPFSPAAVRAGAVPGVKTRAGLSCAGSAVVLLGGNYIRATFSSANGLKLRNGTGATAPGIAYVASADPGGTYAFAQSAQLDYMQNNLLNLLGLLGSSSADLPLYVRPSGGALPVEGTYTDRITIDWNWYICPVVVAVVCVGTPDTGTGRTTIDVTLTVAQQNATVAMTATTSWDPVNGTNAPKALPGSRRRVAVSLTNPDLVPLDGGTLGMVLPTPAGTVIALDGDGTGSGGAAITLSDGAPASGVSLRYAGPGDQGDDVDFSADGGKTWSYVPVAGDIASEARVTHVQIRPQGAMAKQSSFAVNVPYLVR